MENNVKGILLHVLKEVLRASEISWSNSEFTFKTDFKKTNLLK